MTDSPARVTAIMVTWNSERTIELCLDALQNQVGIKLEIILVDNASQDGTLALAERYPQVKIISNPNNMGFCHANNFGFSQANGDFILFINPDVRLAPGYINTLTTVLERQLQAGAITGKLLRMTPEGEQVKMDGRAVIDSVGIHLKRTRQAVDKGRGEIDRGQYEQECEVFGVCAAAGLFRKQALLDASIDGQVFDERFFAYYEDVDLAWRLSMLGWKNLYTPTAIAYHARGWRESRGSRKEIKEIVRYHSFKNKRLMILKNERRKTLFPNLIFILGYEFFAIGYALLKEPFLFKAYKEIWQDLPHIRHWRAEIQQRMTPQ
jgi:GT2 family glycosyltransferase